MLIPTKIQLDKTHYDFIKMACKDLHYRSLSDYVRQAVENKMKDDRKRLRAKKRQAAMEMMAAAPYENVFESIDGDDFESR
ncbi:MAG: crotonobetainyl-CoA--carnitine CoA-transferase [Deltaproteobacteria bacterium]